MSITGVKSRFLYTIVKTNGVIGAFDFQALVDYAKEGRLTSGELKALLQPGDYLEGDSTLKAAGIEVGDITFTAEALLIAKQLGDQFSLAPFPGLPQLALIQGPVPSVPTGTISSDIDAPTLSPLEQAVANRAEALKKGHDLGTFKDWELQTAGADVKFFSEANGKKYPALVLNKPDWKDPDPINLVESNKSKLTVCTTSAELKTVVDSIIGSNTEYFSAEGLDLKGVNAKYGIQNIRRNEFFTQLNGLLPAVALSGAERTKSKGELVMAKEGLLLDRDYQMEVGSHTNYWPYWNNYVSFLFKVLDQTPKDSDGFDTIKNRIRDIVRRKTVFTRDRSVDERNFEKSLGGALVYNPQYAKDVGHRVSVKAGSTPFKPQYELLTVKTENLPDVLKEYAGAHVVRMTGDELQFDFMGKDKGKDLAQGRTGQLLPEGLAKYIDATDITDPEKSLTFRELESGESIRHNISMDWDDNGSINVARIMIGWWGHCHNEAPLNAMGVDPKKGVKIYRADRQLDLEQSSTHFTEKDAWNVAGAFTSGHEGGYARVTSNGQFQSTRVNDTLFVGKRNDGGHWFSLSLPGQGTSPVKIDAEVTGLWHKSNPEERYSDTMSRFRRDIESDDGSFSINPDWLGTDPADDDQITLDGVDRKINLKVKCFTLDGAGWPTEVEEYPSIDPTKDTAVKLSTEILERNPEGGGKIIEHYYNAKTKDYHSVTLEVLKDNKFVAKEISRADAVGVDKVTIAQETTYDSVLELHQFLSENPGLPCTFDTSSGKAVWNYPVNHTRIDKLKTMSKEEEGQTFTYTTYKMTYDTMGGPSGNSRYIIKRDQSGNSIRAVALDPMPDFGFRNEHWESAPVTLDIYGQVAYNLKALQSGYLTNASRQSLVTDLWERQSEILFAALSDQTAEGNALTYINTDGHMLSFDSVEEYDTAVEADKALRALEQGDVPSAVSSPSNAIA